MPPNRLGISGLSDTHFSFGTDENVKAFSTYCRDFNNSRISPLAMRKLRPPSPAQVFPVPDKGHEKVKWLTSTKRDFFNYMPRNMELYRESLDEYKRVKVFQTLGHTWTVRETLPPLTRTGQDYIPPRTCNMDCASAVPKLLSRIKQNRPTHEAYRNYRGETEASHAYQWPTQQRALRSIYRRVSYPIKSE